MKKLTLLYLLSLTIGLIGCGSRLVVTPPLPTALPIPTTTPTNAAGAGLTFFEAWQIGNYEGMYSMLSDRSRALMAQEVFIGRYREIIEQARILSVAYQPISTFQEGDSAEIGVKLSLETAIVGTLVREQKLPMIYENGRWAVIWSDELILPELKDNNQLKMQVDAPARGTLYDIGDTRLAYQGQGVSLGVIPAKLEDEAGFLQLMSTLLNRSPEAIKARYQSSPPDWIVSLGVISPQLAQANFYEMQAYVDKGLLAQTANGRIYNDQGIAPHLIGFVREIPADLQEAYWAKGFRPDEKVGLIGLEKSAENYLAGRHGGRLLLLSSMGEELDIVQEAEMQSGLDVHTTFSSTFQIALQNALAEAIESNPTAEKGGAIVVLNVNTGAVLGMASYPSFDASLFSDLSNDSQALTELTTNPLTPLINRAAQSGYPPGSTFKIVTFSAALSSGLYSADSPYTCTGVWDGLGPTAIKYDWKSEGHGTLTLVDAISQSCNTFTYQVGYTMNQQDPFFLPTMARSFGLGELTQIDLDETEGNIPDPDYWVARYGEQWVPGHAVNMAIGQGDVLASPLQVANYTAAVANGGTLYKPHLISWVAESKTTPKQIIEPVVLKQLPLSAEQLSAVQRGMHNVTSSVLGTAVDKMRGLPISTAGKTGTAQVSGEDVEPHSWFTGYAPYETPEIAITVLVENSGEGSAVAAPIFRRVVELYYGFNITPYPWQ